MGWISHPGWASAAQSTRYGQELEFRIGGECNSTSEKSKRKKEYEKVEKYQGLKEESENGEVEAKTLNWKSDSNIFQKQHKIIRRVHIFKKNHLILWVVKVIIICISVPFNQEERLLNKRYSIDFRIIFRNLFLQFFWPLISKIFIQHTICTFTECG